jgi:aminoglycoside phosphotransferase (APT) family kinase protein
MPDHTGPARWVHGDLHGLNVLVSRRRISGVIDFGDLCAGDPAVDLACAWLLLDRPARARLRDLLGVGDEVWERGRGWALYLAVMFLAHSAESHVNEAIGARGLAEVLPSGTGPQGPAVPDSPTWRTSTSTG